MSALVLLALAALAPPGPPPSLSLGGIVLGQSEASVVQALGRPRARVEKVFDFLPVRLSYPGFTVLLDAQGVGGLISSSRQFCTPVGACPGMAYAKVQRLYGPALVTEGVGGLSVGYVFGDGCWLEFRPAAGTVRSIAVACSP